MSATAVDALIAGAGVFLSLVGSAFISGTRWGRVQSDIANIKAAQSHMVTKDELQAVSRDVSEIKGMFKLTLKE